MSHIPMPTGGATESPETEFDGNHPSNASLVAPIEVPIPSTNEVPRALGEDEGVISPWFYKQWRRIATLEWSTNDPIGKILWQMPVSPLHLDPTLAWQMALFHGWGGNFEISFRAVATGFHAGQIAIVSYPPRIDPSEISSPLEYSVYPYDVIDVKKLTTTEFTIQDRRNTKYHYLRHDNKDTLDADIGGRVAIYVDTPLTTSATGVQKISLAIWGKCASNFKPAFIRSPLTHVPKNSVTVPQTLIDILNVASHRTYLSNGPNSLQRLTIYPSNVTTLTKYFSNCVKLDGSLIHKVTIYPQTYSFHVDRSIAKYSSENTLTWDIRSADTYFPECGAKIVYLIDNSNVTKVFSKEIAAFSPASDRVLLTSYTDLEIGHTYTVKYEYGSDMPQFDSRNSLVLRQKGTGFVLWQPIVAGNCIQFQPLTTLLNAGFLAGHLEPTEAFLIRVQSKLTKLPLFHMKLHPEGFFSAPALDTTYQNFDIADITFAGEGVIGLLDTFPDVPAINMAQHMVIAESRDKAARRLARQQLKQVPSQIDVTQQ
uniref:Calicivirus coat protein domain-containing protein n=1 Tax=Picornavirales sp. TaxID=1955153 RepID=A0A6M3YTW4_9VIRU|nr:MAG: hypothetical protein 2 [Picornavirales sp.]